MKLTSTRIDRAAAQLDAWPVPDTDPTADSLNEMFGEHTFFLDDDGLSIVEAELDGPADTARVVKLAIWADKKRTILAPCPAEMTETVVALGDSD
jgi:hypothetical protein